MNGLAIILRNAHRTEDLFPIFWALFQYAGKAVNDRDKEITLRLWLNFERDEHLRIVDWVAEMMKYEWSSTRYTPMPQNALKSEGWRRVSTPRQIPNPDDPAVKLARYMEEEKKRGLR